MMDGRGRMRLPSGVRSAGHGSAGLSPLQWHCRLDASWNSRAAWMALDVNFLLGRGWKGHRNQKQGPVNIRWIALLSYSMSMHYEYSTPKICTKSVRFHVRSKSLEMDATSSTSAYVRLVQSTLEMHHRRMHRQLTARSSRVARHFSTKPFSNIPV